MSSTRLFTIISKSFQFPATSCHGAAKISCRRTAMISCCRTAMISCRIAGRPDLPTQCSPHRHQSVYGVLGGWSCVLSRSVRRYTDLISLFGAELGTAVHPPADPLLPLMSVLPRAVPDTTQAGLMCDPPQKVALQRSITDVTCSDISLLHIGQLCLLGAC